MFKGHSRCYLVCPICRVLCYVMLACYVYMLEWSTVHYGFPKKNMV